MENNTSNFSDITRGGQITLHAVRMFLQVFRYGILLALFTFALVFYYRFTSQTTQYDRYVLEQIIDANIKIFLHGDKVKHEVKTPRGQTVELRAIEFIRSRQAYFHLYHCKKAFWCALKQGGMASLATLLLFFGYFKWKGQSQKKLQSIKGQPVVSDQKLTKLLNKKRMNSPFNLAGVPLIKDSEVQHILLAGTTGSGKTVAMKELMDKTRDKGQRAIVYDIEGTFIPTYYRADKDILLNPIDERTPVWNIWQECEDLADFDTAAISLMPEHLAGTDPFWIRSAHTIFAAAALRLKSLNKAKTQLLLESIFAENLQTIAELVKRTPAAPLVSEKIERTAVSIKATLSTYCKSLIYLKEERDSPLFSIRRWVEADKGDSWLFIASQAQKIDALKPLISVWLDVAAKSILSLEPSIDRRLWFFLDELPSLHKLPSLMNALSRGRKYGACFVAAIQDVHQLDAIYGRDEAKSLTSLFNTKVFYRTQEPSSAAWMSKVMGGIELLEKREGFSYGAHEMRDGVSIHSERRQEPLVRDSEFLELQDLQAYLRLPGAWPVAKLNFKFKPRKETNPAFVPRDLSHLLLISENLETQSEALQEKPGKPAESSSSILSSDEALRSPSSPPSLKQSQIEYTDFVEF